MAQILGAIAVVALVVTLSSAIMTIWMEMAGAADQFLKLTDILLSWKVLAAAVAIGGASTFVAELKSLLNRLFVKEHP